MYVFLHINVLRFIAYPPTKSGFKCSVIKSVKKLLKYTKLKTAQNQRIIPSDSMTDLTTERTTWPCPRAYQSAYSFVNTTKKFHWWSVPHGLAPECAKRLTHNSMSITILF